MMTIAPLACHSTKSEEAIASSFTPTIVISRADTLILTFLVRSGNPARNHRRAAKFQFHG
jgi:hypothetical protein